MSGSNLPLKKHVFTPPYCMPSTKKAQKATAARAQAAKSQKKRVEVADPVVEKSELDDNHDLDIECTSWTGTVNYVPLDTDDDKDDKDWKDTDLDGGHIELESDEDDNNNLEDLKGEDLLDGLQNQWVLEMQP